MASDPVKVDPSHYTVEFENHRLRVLRIRYGAGEKSIMHGHPESVAVVLRDGRVRFELPDGRIRDADVKAGQFHWHPSGEHSPENIGDGPLELLMIELKD